MECNSTIASSYLFRKMNHIVFDYIHPLVMEVLLYTEKWYGHPARLTCSANYITTQSSNLWKKVSATDAYIQSIAFVKKYGTMGWEKVKEYWRVMIQYINTTFNIDIYQAIKTSYTKVVTLICWCVNRGLVVVGTKYPEVCKKVEEGWSKLKETVKPSSLKHYIDTLRNVFQLTSAVRAERRIHW